MVVRWDRHGRYSPTADCSGSLILVLFLTLHILVRSLRQSSRSNNRFVAAIIRKPVPLVNFASDVGCGTDC